MFYNTDTMMVGLLWLHNNPPVSEWRYIFPVLLGITIQIVTDYITQLKHLWSIKCSELFNLGFKGSYKIFFFMTHFNNIRIVHFIERKNSKRLFTDFISRYSVWFMLCLWIRILYRDTAIPLTLYKTVFWNLSKKQRSSVTY